MLKETKVCQSWLGSLLSSRTLKLAQQLYRNVLLQGQWWIMSELVKLSALRKQFQYQFTNLCLDLTCLILTSTIKILKGIKRERNVRNIVHIVNTQSPMLTVSISNLRDLIYSLWRKKIGSLRSTTQTITTVRRGWPLMFSHSIKPQAVSTNLEPQLAIKLQCLWPWPMLRTTKQSHQGKISNMNRI